MSPRRETWTAHAGDVAFAITAPPGWAAVQRRYLAHYLTSKFSERALKTFSLDVTVDAKACRELAEQVADTAGRRVETVPGVVCLESARTGGVRCFTVATDDLENQSRSYAIRVRGSRIELYLDPAGARVHSYPLRLMREAMLRTYEDHDSLIFHAAGADLQGRGVMICGPRSAGKTTLLTCLLRSAGGDLLSNDRLILHRRSELVAVPLPVPIGRGTLDAVPELGRMTSALSRKQRDVAELPATFGATLKAELSALEFGTALGAHLAPSSRLTAILVPRLTDSADPVRVTLLSGTEARTMLQRSCFTPRDEFWIRPWLVPRATPDVRLRARAQARIDDLASRVPCFAVHFGIRRRLADLESALADVIERTT